MYLQFKIVLIILHVCLTNSYDFVVSVEETNPGLGGYPANINEWTFLTSLKFSNGKFCLGSIISSKYVLTSALCTNGSTYAVGKYQVNGLLSSIGKQFFSKTLVTHRKFKNTYYPYTQNGAFYGWVAENDIGLIRVDDGLINLGEDVKTIKIAEVPLKDGDLCTTVTWGVERKWEDESGLREKDLILITYSHTVIKHEECYKFLPIDEKSMSCTNFDEGFTRPCIGGPGAPLVCNNMLYGVASWGSDCIASYFPTVWAQIYYYQKNINKVLKRNVPPNDADIPAGDQLDANKPINNTSNSDDGLNVEEEFVFKGPVDEEQHPGDLDYYFTPWENINKETKKSKKTTEFDYEHYTPWESTSKRTAKRPKRTTQFDYAYYMPWEASNNNFGDKKNKQPQETGSYNFSKEEPEDTFEGGHPIQSYQYKDYWEMYDHNFGRGAINERDSMFLGRSARREKMEARAPGDILAGQMNRGMGGGKATGSPCIILSRFYLLLSIFLLYCSL